MFMSTFEQAVDSWKALQMAGAERSWKFICYLESYQPALRFTGAVFTHSVSLNYFANVLQWAHNFFLIAPKNSETWMRTPLKRPWRGFDIHLLFCWYGDEIGVGGTAFFQKMNIFIEWIIRYFFEWINSLNEYFSCTIEWIFEWIKKVRYS